MYAIMIMTALGCGGDIICWKPIRHMPVWDTLAECQNALKHGVAPGHVHLQCRPVEREAEPLNPFDDVPP